MSLRRRLFLKQLATLLPVILVGPQIGRCNDVGGSSSAGGNTPSGGSQANTGDPGTSQTDGTTGSGSGMQTGTGGTGVAQSGGTGRTTSSTPAAAPTPPPVNSPFQVGDRFFTTNRFQEALDALADGGTLYIRGGAAYQVTGFLRRNNVRIKALGGKAALDGLRNVNFPAGGKGLIVQQGRAATYEDLIFRNVIVPDNNGVGVRIEGGGTTTFQRCEFRDSQQGILTRNGADWAIVMRDCIGDNLGAGDGQSHGVYCGTIGSLTVTGGAWTNSRGGHLLKSRAARTRIENVQLVEGEASRAIDLPNGGGVEILGCTISQSQATHNSDIIAYGFEVGRPFWPTNSFTFRASNTVVNTRRPPGTILSFAGWFTGPRLVEGYTYNGSSSKPPGFTG
jgi:Right handed beta helix region